MSSLIPIRRSIIKDIVSSKNQTTWISKYSSTTSILSSKNPTKPKQLSGFRHRTIPISITDGDYTDYDSNSSFSNAFDLGSSKFSQSRPKLSKKESAIWEPSSDFEFDAERDQERRSEETAIYKMERENEYLRRKYIEASKPPVRVPEIDGRGQAYGRGGRKTSSAHVWVYPGEGYITVNGREFVDYFPRDQLREDILGPMIASETCGLFDVTCTVHGGGNAGQAGAMRHGIARALEKYNPDYRPAMKAHGFMTRDPRMVERKKVGLKKARKAPQWVKR